MTRSKLSPSTLLLLLAGLAACDDDDGKKPAPTPDAEVDMEVERDAGEPLPDAAGHPDMASPNPDGQVVDPDEGVEADAGVDPDDGVEPDDGVPPDDGVEADMGPVELCGNGARDEGEGCDDGNREDGDGCSATCEVEPQIHEEPDSRDAPLALEFDDEGLALARFVLDGVDEDWFGFELERVTDLVIETHRPGDRFACDGDTELSLFAAGAQAPRARNDDAPYSLCSLLEPSTPALRDVPAGSYLVRVTPRTDGPLTNLLAVRRVGPIADGGACHGFGLLGRCAEGRRCGNQGEDRVGACLPPGCGDGLRDAGEACDGGALCDEQCALLGPTEVEPNEAADAASAFGESLAPGLGAWQITSTFASTDDVDVLGFTLPEGAPVEIGLFTRDGFLDCPGVVSAVIHDADGAEVGAANHTCDVWSTRPLAPGSYTLTLRAGGDVVVGVPLLTFLAPVAIVGVGEGCGGADTRCAEGAWCDEAQGLCVAHECGDGREGPGEECDDGGREDGDGCSTDCQLEATAIDGGGVFPGAVAEGERDLFAFTVDALGYVELENSDGEGRCPGDTAIRLLRRGERGFEVVAENDDGPLPPCSRLAAWVEPGSWRVEVRHFFGEALEAYSLSAFFHPVSGVGEPCGGDAVCAPELYCADPLCAAHRCGDGVRGPGEGCDDGNEEDGDGCSAGCESEAVDVGVGGDFAAHTEAGEVDFFTFTTDGPRTLRAVVDDGMGGCPADTFMNLERANEDGGFDRVASDDDGGPDVCSAIERDLQAGTWRLQVLGLGGAAIGDYVLHVRLAGVAGDGQACDRSGLDVACEPGLFCLMTAIDGAGLCGELLEVVDEVEGGGPMEVRPDVAVRAQLQPQADGDDWFDAFAVVLDVPGLLAVETGDGDGDCSVDTELHRVDGAVLAADGVDAAIAGASASSLDISGANRCSRIVGPLDAGTHTFLALDNGRNSLVDYQVWFRILFPVEAGGRCDAAGVQSVCAEGFACVDEDADGDGRCAVVE